MLSILEKTELLIYMVDVLMVMFLKCSKRAEQESDSILNRSILIVIFPNSFPLAADNYQSHIP